MHAAVNTQAAAAGEVVATLLTCVRPLAGMCAQMHPEAGLLAERFPACTAGEWPQASVDGQLVHVDAAAGGEAFPTGGAGVRFFLPVDPQVS